MNSQIATYIKAAAAEFHANSTRDRSHDPEVLERLNDVDIFFIPDPEFNATATATAPATERTPAQ
jgi:hypothetical protein